MLTLFMIAAVLTGILCLVALACIVGGTVLFWIPRLRFLASWILFVPSLAALGGRRRLGLWLPWCADERPVCTSVLGVAWRLIHRWCARRTRRSSFVSAFQTEDRCGLNALESSASGGQLGGGAAQIETTFFTSLACGTGPTPLGIVHTHGYAGPSGESVL